MNHATHVWLERALLLIIVGLVVQLFCMVHITPGTFVIYVVGGLSSMMLGVVAFIIALVKARRAGEGPSQPRTSDKKEPGDEA